MDGSDASTQGAGPEACPLQTACPTLYGRLLMANERLERSARGCGYVTFLVWFAVVVLLASGWGGDLLGTELSPLADVGFYIGFLVVCGFGWWRWDQWRTAVNYRRSEREDLAAETRSAGLTQETLLAAIEGHDALDVVAKEIKADREFGGRRR